MADRRAILVILDGLADRSFGELGHRTPLIAAKTPNLDRLSKMGSVGLFHALKCGVPLSSEAAHFFMMGASPREFPGRAYFEALGFGVEFGTEDVLVLARLVSLERRGSELVLSERSPKIEPDEADELLGSVGSFAGRGLRLNLRRTGSSSGVLVIEGPASPDITDTEPFLRGMALVEAEPLAGGEGDEEALRTAGFVNDYLIHAHETLEAHPINKKRLVAGKMPLNGLTTQRPGRARRLATLKERWGLDVLSISSAPLYAGLFKALGARAKVVSEGKDPGEEMEAKTALALESLDEFHLVHVHTKAPDDAAHTKDPGAKVAAIEALDRGLGHLAAELEKRDDLVAAVTSDHATPSAGRMIHSGGASPLLIAGSWVIRDGVGRFDEAACSKGALGLLRGDELMLTLISLMDRGKLWGLRDNPEDLPYYPGPRKHLKILD